MTDNKMNQPGLRVNDNRNQPQPGNTSKGSSTITADKEETIDDASETTSDAGMKENTDDIEGTTVNEQNKPTNQDEQITNQQSGGTNEGNVEDVEEQSPEIGKDKNTPEIDTPVYDTEKTQDKIPKMGA